MQTKWDDLDEAIKSSFLEVNPDESYNKTLINKLHTKKPFMNQTRTAAFSLITAGFIIMIMCTSTFQYRMVELKFKLRAQAIALQYQYEDKFSVIKYLIGE